MLLCGAFIALLLLVGGVSAGVLDFPPVDLEDNMDSSLAVSFTHPFLFHNKTPADELFRFTVSTDVGDFNGSCTSHDVCKLPNVSFPAGGEKCVALKGALDGRGVGSVAFRGTGRICLSVVAPKNVELSCKNVNVSVSWEAGGQTALTRFRVHVGGSAGHHLEETTEHRFDLSRFVWASESSYLGFHSVTVTAKEGGNQSESTTRTFTFNFLRRANVECKLDFPTVDLNEEESGATLSFMNPLVFYKELREASKSAARSVQFTASSNNKDFKGECKAKDVCKLDISFLPGGSDKCVKKLTGLLFDGVSQVGFTETGPICASSSTADPTGFLKSLSEEVGGAYQHMKETLPPSVYLQHQHIWRYKVLPGQEGDEQMSSKEADKLTLTLCILLLLFVIVVVGIIVAVWKVRGWTMETPKPRISPIQPHEERGRYALVTNADVISFVKVADHKPGKNPTVSTEDDEEEEEAALQGDGVKNYRYLETGLSDDSTTEEEEEEEEEAALQGDCVKIYPYAETGLSDDSTDNSQNTETVSLEDDAEEVVFVVVEDEEDRMEDDNVPFVVEEEDDDDDDVVNSPYDCPHALRVDMGDGDMVTAYSGR